MAAPSPPVTVHQDSLVTALRYQSPFLYAGIGSLIKVWKDDVSRFKLVTKHSLSKAYNVYAIEFVNKQEELEKNSSKVCHRLVLTHQYGFTYCSFHHDLQSDQCNVEEHFSKHISYMVMCATSFNGKTYILTYKNQVQCYDLSTCHCEQYALEPRCNLYSGHFFHITKRSVLIASGTAFNKLCISKLQFYDKGAAKIVDKQELTGHTGVIFSIDYHAGEDILISASDDRTIRTWKRVENTFEALHTYYGHKARIWKVVSMTHDSLPLVASVGQDSQLILWNLRAPFTKRWSTTLNNNNSLWGLEVTPSRVICGGSDGAVYAISIPYMFDEDSFQKTRLCLSNMKIPKLLMFLKMNRDSMIETCLSCVTFERELYYIDPIGDPTDACQKFDWFGENTVGDDFVAYTTDNSQRYMTFGCADGKVALLCRLKTGQMNICYLKVFESSPISEIIFIDENQFLVCTEHGKVRIVVVVFNGEQMEFREDTPEITLPLKRRPQAKAAMIYNEDLLFIGCYSGHLFVYTISQFDDETNPTPMCAWNIHDNGVTSIQRHSQLSLVYSSGRNGTIEEFLVQEVDLFKMTVHRLRTFVHLSNLKNISGFYLDPCGIRFIYGFTGRYFELWDLKKKTSLFKEECGGLHRPFDFAIIPESNGDYQLNFGYIKKSDVICIRQRIPGDDAFQKMDPSLMPLKVNTAVCLLDQPDHAYFILAGEVNYLQLWHFHKDEKRFDLEMTLYGHLSSVSAVKVAMVEEDKLWMYGISVGSRSQLIVWRFSFLGDTMICEERANRNSKQDEQEIGNDVRYLDLDCYWTRNDPIEFFIIVASSDRSFRVFKMVDCLGYSAPSQLNEVKKVSVGDSCVLRVRYCCSTIAAVATNDGFLRIWFFTYDKLPNITPEADRSVELIDLTSDSEDDSDDDDEFSNDLSSAKDKERMMVKRKLKEEKRLEKTYGNLQRWDGVVTRALSTLSNCTEMNTFQLHQSGINALDFLLSPKTLLVATGGDDSILNLTLIEFDGEKSTVNMKWNISKEGAHTCQITGLKFYNGQQLHSVGIDQVMVQWKIVPNKVAKWELRQLASHSLSVADVSSMFFASKWKSENGKRAEILPKTLNDIRITHSISIPESVRFTSSDSIAVSTCLARKESSDLGVIEENQSEDLRIQQTKPEIEIIDLSSDEAEIISSDTSSNTIQIDEDEPDDVILMESNISGDQGNRSSDLLWESIQQGNATTFEVQSSENHETVEIRPQDDLSQTNMTYDQKMTIDQMGDEFGDYFDSYFQDQVGINSIIASLEPGLESDTENSQVNDQCSNFNENFATSPESVRKETLVAPLTYVVAPKRTFDQTEDEFQQDSFNTTMSALGSKASNQYDSLESDFVSCQVDLNTTICSSLSLVSQQSEGKLTAIETLSMPNLVAVVQPIESLKLPTKQCINTNRLEVNSKTPLKGALKKLNSHPTKHLKRLDSDKKHKKKKRKKKNKTELTSKLVGPTRIRLSSKFLKKTSLSGSIHLSSKTSHDGEVLPRILEKNDAKANDNSELRFSSHANRLIQSNTTTDDSHSHFSSNFEADPILMRAIDKKLKLKNFRKNDLSQSPIYPEEQRSSVSSASVLHFSNQTLGTDISTADSTVCLNFQPTASERKSLTEQSVVDTSIPANHSNVWRPW